MFFVDGDFGCCWCLPLLFFLLVGSFGCLLVILVLGVVSGFGSLLLAALIVVC